MDCPGTIYCALSAPYLGYRLHLACQYQCNAALPWHQYAPLAHGDGSMMMEILLGIAPLKTLSSTRLTEGF